MLICSIFHFAKYLHALKSIPGSACLSFKHKYWINWISILGTSYNENFQLALSSWASMKSSLFHGAVTKNTDKPPSLVTISTEKSTHRSY